MSLNADKCRCPTGGMGCPGQVHAKNGKSYRQGSATGARHPHGINDNGDEGRDKMTANQVPGLRQGRFGRTEQQYRRGTKWRTRIGYPDRSAMRNMM